MGIAGQIQCLHVKPQSVKFNFKGLDNRRTMTKAILTLSKMAASQAIKKADLLQMCIQGEIIYLRKLLII